MTLATTLLVPLVAVLAQQGPQAITGQNVSDQIACAPMSLSGPPLGAIRVAGGLQHGRIMFGPGDSLLIDAGARHGITRGQVYFVRRHVTDMFTPASADFTPVSIHTAGWVTILDAREDTSVAQVTHACDGILDGDYLEPYSAPVAPASAVAAGEPDYDHPARIVMGDERMQTGAAGTLMLINRGTDHGVRAGQTLTIFRSTMDGRGPLLDVGTGTILSVRPQTALMRIDSSRDAVSIGDMAAMHRIP
jgi:hypothetical protein